MPDRPGYRIYLSPPSVGERERDMVLDALDSGWIAPLGPHVERFEAELAELVGVGHALALASGTAAIHLALIATGVGPGDAVAVSSLTFAGSVNPILYVGAEPVFVDSEAESWNMDPRLLRELLERRQAEGRPIKAVLVVHIYGQSADLDALTAACEDHGAILLEDAAEAIGTEHEGRQVGAAGRASVLSFNGNKMVTTSGGGALVSDDAALVAHARKLATQSREPAPHYEHREVGYNYRLSNLLAALGRAQLEDLGRRLARRRAVFDRYRSALGGLDGVTFMPEAPWGRHSRWLTTLLVDRGAAGFSREDARLALDAERIEARPVWKPMHLQPVFAGYEAVGGDVSRRLFEEGLCLPSGPELTDDEVDEVAGVVRSLAR